MSANPEKEDHSFFVKEENCGIAVTDQNTGNKFFQTQNGGWFWLASPRNPFGEDVAITGKTAEYLSGIVQTAQESPCLGQS